MHGIAYCRGLRNRIGFGGIFSYLYQDYVRIIFVLVQVSTLIYLFLICILCHTATKQNCRGGGGFGAQGLGLRV